MKKLTTLLLGLVLIGRRSLHNLEVRVKAVDAKGKVERKVGESASTREW